MAVVDVPDIAGQGIAWDRTAEVPTLYGIYRPDKTVIVTQMPTVRKSRVWLAPKRSERCTPVWTNFMELPWERMDCKPTVQYTN